MNKKIIYNRILFFVLGVCSVILVYLVISKSKGVDSAGKNSRELALASTNDGSSQGRIPDSIKDMTKWVKVGSRRIGYYYRKGDKVYWSDAEINHHDEFVPPIAEADAETFVIAVGTNYAKDKNHVYWWSYDEDIIEYDEWPDGGESPVEILKGADPKAFRSLGSGFACDESKMYFEGEEIEWDDRFFDPAVCRLVGSMWGTNGSGFPCEALSNLGIAER